MARLPERTRETLNLFSCPPHQLDGHRIIKLKNGDRKMGKLNGKVAVVTGASKGIGAAIAKTLGPEGASVVVNYATDKAGADKVVKKITDSGSKAIAVQADVSNQDNVARLFQEAKKAYGKVDIVVNNAGIYEFRPLEQIDADHFHKHFNLNVLGTIFATQEAVKLMPAEGGSIVNVSSVVTLTPPPNGSVYSATKSALDTITRTLAQELGPRKIRINSIAPGFTITEGAISSGAEKAFKEYAVSRTPLARAGEPDDIAKAALFLVSDDSGWVTGDVLHVGGGVRF